MSGVLSGLGWLLGATSVILGAAWLAQKADRRVGRYYHAPDEPTLLDAPHAAEQARRRAAQADRLQAPDGGVR